VSFIDDRRPPIFIGTAILVLTLLLVASGSPAYSQSVARFISDHQWEAEVQITFHPEVRDREPKIDRLLADQLLEKLKAQRVTYDLRKQVAQEGRLTYGLKFQGTEGWGQFRKALFAATDPTLPFTDGPTLLELRGSVKSGETLALILDTNPASGYAWEIQTLEALKLKSKEGRQFQSAGNRLGGSTRQIISLEGVTGGETAVRILYRRPWIESQIPRMEISLRATEISLISDLSNPDPPPDQPRTPRNQKELLADTPPILGLPVSFDWRDSGILTPVRDQGSCGSCWAFGTVGPFEANLKWKSNLTTDLSEEFLLSCNTDGFSCNGGWWAHEYHHNQIAISQTQPGAVLETDFPYAAASQSCNRLFSHPYRLVNWGYVGNDSSIPAEEAIKNALYSYGPVAVAVCAGPKMQGYRGGVFSLDERNYCGGGVNHAVVLVGWNDTENTWIMRNSWGASWGESGYMRITRGTSNIGYSANYVIYTAPFTVSHWIHFPYVFHNYGESLSALQNGDFESGRDGTWTESSSNGYTLVLTPGEGLPITPHSGSWAAWLGGADFEISILSQKIRVPETAQTLSFWYWIGSKGGCGYDTAGVYLGTQNLKGYDLCVNHNTNGWVQETVTISGYRGQTLDLTFKAVTDNLDKSNFFVDDVVVSGAVGDPLAINFSPAVKAPINLPTASKRR
jgi:C1A family cysteine protease/predicted secreted protein